MVVCEGAVAVAAIAVDSCSCGVGLGHHVVLSKPRHSTVVLQIQARACEELVLCQMHMFRAIEKCVRARVCV